MRRHQLLIKKFLRCCVAACESRENYLASFNLFNSSSRRNNNQLIIINECDHRNVGYICRTQQTHSAFNKKTTQLSQSLCFCVFTIVNLHFFAISVLFRCRPPSSPCDLCQQHKIDSLLSLMLKSTRKKRIYVVLFLRWNFNELKLFKTLSSSWDAYKVCNPTTSNMHNKREVGSRRRESAWQGCDGDEEEGELF